MKALLKDEALQTIPFKWLVLTGRVNSIYRLFQGLAPGASPSGTLQVMG